MSKKKFVVVMLEILHDKGVGRAYTKIIEHVSAKEFRPFSEAYIGKEAHVITDVRKGYLPLTKDYPKLVHVPTGKRKNFKQLHTHKMNI